MKLPPPPEFKEIERNVIRYTNKAKLVGYVIILLNELEQCICGVIDRYFFADNILKVPEFNELFLYKLKFNPKFEILKKLKNRLNMDPKTKRDFDKALEFIGNLKGLRNDLAHNKIVPRSETEFDVFSIKGNKIGTITKEQVDKIRRDIWNIRLIFSKVSIQNQWITPPKLKPPKVKEKVK